MQTTSSNADSAAPVKKLVQSIRSDDLPKFADVLRKITLFKDTVNILQVDVILDANVVIKDLLWLAKKRTNPAARTDLMEVMDCEVVRAHAPFYLIREINVNIPVLAEEHGVALKVLRDLWKQYRKRIKFVAVGGPAKTRNFIDPKDAPYLRLQKKLSFPIASQDHHITAMGGKVVRIQIFGALRAYSRSAAIEYQFKISGVGSAMVFAALMEGSFALMKNIGAVPKPVLWGVVILFGLLLAHPSSRKKIGEIGNNLFQGGAFVLEAAMTMLLPLLDEHSAAKETAQFNLLKAQSALGTGQPSPSGGLR